MATLLLRDDVFLTHDPGPGHPENAERLAAVYRDLDARPVPDTDSVSPGAAPRRSLERVHGAHYVDRIAKTEGVARTPIDDETIASETTWEAAVRAAGAAVEGAEAVCRGGADGAFALVRPPGHHAEAFHGTGFCFFNNVAVAAAHAVEELGLQRVLVLDPDVHHGNGTQHAFWSRDDVLYVSSHRFPFYPGTGAADEVGEADGAGYTVNLPMDGGMGDADFFHLYDRVVAPIVAQWEPQLILVSAGFDTWQRDPLGGMAMSADGFAALFGLFGRWAGRHCPGRLVYVLEGGYDPAGVATGARVAIEQLAGVADAPVAAPGRPSDRAFEIEAVVKQRLAPFWAALRG